MSGSLWGAGSPLGGKRPPGPDPFPHLPLPRIEPAPTEPGPLSGFMKWGKKAMFRPYRTGICAFCHSPTATKPISLQEFDFDETPDEQSVQLGAVVACGACWRRTLHETIGKAVKDVVSTEEEQLKAVNKDVENLIAEKVIEMFMREAE